MDIITKDLVCSLLPPRYQDSNKGSYGKVLNIAGCYNYQGAAYLSSVTPLKVGAGLVTLATTKPVINNIAAALPWVTFFPIQDSDDGCIAKNAFIGLAEVIENYDVVSIGPGLSTKDDVCKFVKEILDYLSKSEKKVVIDADALNIVAKLGISKLPLNSVLTPHPMEMSRLLALPVDVIQSNREKYVLEAAKKYNCTVVLKGNDTLIATSDGQVWKNTTGNSALAKAGSGDVLTGMIAGFMAQGLSSLQGAILSVYLHGLSGELASKKLTQYGVLATDQIDFIPLAIESIIQA